MTPQILLHKAIRNDRIDLAKQALAQGASLHGKGGFDETPLMVAVNARKTLMIDWLLDQQVDVNQKGRAGDTVLHVAAQNGDSGSLWKFLHHGGDINAQNDQKETPLFVAAYGQNWRCVDFLLSRGGAS